MYMKMSGKDTNKLNKEEKASPANGSNKTGSNKNQNKANVDNKSPIQPTASLPSNSAAPSLLASLGGFGGFSIIVAVVALALSQVSLVKDMFGFSSVCLDQNENCQFWAANNECELNPEYMSRICTKSCQLCSAAKEQPSIVSKEPVDTGTKETDNVQDTRQSEPLDTREGDNVEEDDDEGYEMTEFDEEFDEEDATGAPRVVHDHVADSSDSCVDSDQDCSFWAENGECEANPQWMLTNCRKSCKTCGVDLCQDSDPDCNEFADRGECEKNPDWMLVNCKKACGVCGEGGRRRETENSDACRNNHENCEFWASEGECEANPSYMLENCQKACKTCESEQRDEPTAPCKDKHPTRDCQIKRDEGECESNPGWMIVMCGKTCNKCDLLLQKKRCVPEVFDDPSYIYEDALQEKGRLTQIFEKVIREYPKTEIILQPPKGPWIVKLPKFITDLERETLLNFTLPKVKRSTDQGGFNEEGIQEQVVSQGRTSMNAWCMGECADSEIVIGLTKRLADLLTVPTKNFESYQVLQYKIGQKYDVHHDSSEEDLDDMAGPRILTFFMYLSEVEEGGETFFNKLGIKVKPETGMAILWPSVLDEDPSKIDWRTTHAALPVIKGTKLAANLWVHMRDFTTPNLWGCTGAFD